MSLKFISNKLSETIFFDVGVRKQILVGKIVVFLLIIEL